MEDIKLIINKFVTNKEVLQKKFKIESFHNRDIYTFLTLLNEESINTDNIKKISKEISSRCKLTYPMRTYYNFMYSNILVRYENSNELIENIKINSTEIDNDFKLKSTMINAAYFLNKFDVDNKEVINKVIELTKKFSKEYFYFNRYSFASHLVLASLLDKSADDIKKSIDKSYEILKENKIKYSSALSIAFILLFSENATEDIKKIIRIKNKLKEEKYNIGNGYELSVIALYCLIEEFDSVIINNIKLTFNYLKENVKFGFITPQKHRLMYSAILCILSNKLNDDMKNILESYLMLYLTTSIQEYVNSTTSAAVL